MGYFPGHHPRRVNKPKPRISQFVANKGTIGLKKYRCKGGRFVRQMRFLLTCLPALLLATHAPAETTLATLPEAISPSEGTLRLFDGRTLKGWTTWLEQGGKNNDHQAYSVVDGTLRISGEGMGYLATENSYRDYILRLEYRWGERTDGSGFVRNSGILLHAVGPDGNAKGIWMTSIECQLAQGCEGDLIVIRGTDTQHQVVPATLTSDTRVASDGRTRWLPGGAKTVYDGKQFWWSQHHVGFEERLDTRGPNDAASPLGEWTAVECVCWRDRITIKINGVVVNECYDVFPAAGKILLENEGNEIYFRNVELSPATESTTQPD